MKFYSRSLSLGTAVMLAFLISILTSSITLDAQAQSSAQSQALLRRNLAGLNYASVRNFQIDNRLEPDGNVGLNMPYSKTMQALRNKVEQVQQKVGVAQDGDYGSATTVAVKRYQSRLNLGTTGHADYRTMLSMGIPRVISGSTAKVIVSLARSQIGVHEWGNNCNPYGPCEEWCADFAKWVWKQAGVDVRGITAASGSFYNYGKSHHTIHSPQTRLYKPKPGDAIVYGTRANSKHVDLVVSVLSDGRVFTIGGNSGVHTDQVALSRTAFFPVDRNAHAIITPKARVN